MTELDPRVVFYLERRKQIDQWYNLRKEVSKVAHGFYASLANEMATRAASLEGDPRLWIHTSQSYPKLFMHRESWCVKKSKEPRVGVGLEWPHSSTMFDNAYVGIWVHSSDDKTGWLSTRIRGATKDQRKREGWKSTHRWPVIKYEVPQNSEYWKHLDEFSRQILDDVDRIWTLLHSIVDKAVTEMSGD